MLKNLFYSVFEQQSKFAQHLGKNDNLSFFNHRLFYKDKEETKTKRDLFERQNKTGDPSKNRKKMIITIFQIQ